MIFTPPSEAEFDLRGKRVFFYAVIIVKNVVNFKNRAG